MLLKGLERRKDSKKSSKSSIQLEPRDVNMDMDWLSKLDSMPQDLFSMHNEMEE